MSDTNTVLIRPLRKVLQKFNEELGQYINSEQRYRLGRVLTVIDASIADPEQRKAIKDLIQNEWWNNNPRPTDVTMTDPHIDMRGLCEALGFELYLTNANQLNAIPGDDVEWSKKHYQKVANEQD